MKKKNPDSFSFAHTYEGQLRLRALQAGAQGWEQREGSVTLERPRSSCLILSRRVIALKTLHLSVVAVIVLSPLKWPFLRISSHRSAPQPADPRAFLWVQRKLFALGTLGPGLPRTPPRLKVGFFNLS